MFFYKRLYACRLVLLTGGSEFSMHGKCMLDEDALLNQSFKGALPRIDLPLIRITSIVIKEDFQQENKIV